jgi:DNA-binding transcriptional ArsR family regulator
MNPARRQSRRAIRPRRPRARIAAAAPAHTPFDAVADPTRRAILDGLRAAPAGRTVNDIASAFTVSRPAISKHLRILRRAALVHERKDGRRRIYTLDPRPLAQIDDWLTAYRLHWAAALIDLKEFVERPES